MKNGIIEEIRKTLDSSPNYDFTNEEIVQYQVDKINAEQGYMNRRDGYDCPRCKNKGYIAVFKLGLNEEPECGFEPCSCKQARIASFRARTSGLGDYLDKTPNDYKATSEWQKHTKEVMLDFMENHAEDSVWFAITGQSGAGKTLVCSIVANHFLKNLHKQVAYIIWTDFIHELKQNLVGFGKDDFSERFNYVKKVEVLYIDEVLQKYTEADLKYLSEIINYRYSNNLKTIISSQKNISELVQIDEASFGRIIEKCGNYLVDIRKDMGKNYRLKNAKAVSV